MSDSRFDDMTDAEFKAWENRMRRRLAVQGMGLRKSRARLPMAHDYGLYEVYDVNMNASLSQGFTLDPEDVEGWANGVAPREISDEKGNTK